MNLPLKILFSRDAANYVRALDRKMQSRVQEKLQSIAAAPFDLRLSKPLSASEKRSARVGGYRILLLVKVVDDVLFVVDVDSRGQIYRNV